MENQSKEAVIKPAAQQTDPPQVNTLSTREDSTSLMVVCGVVAIFTIYILGSSLPSLMRGQSINSPNTKPQANCPSYDGDYAACVAAQTSGGGCAWYGQCNKCGRDNQNQAVVCNTK